MGSLTAGLATLWADVRAHPVAAVLELGSVAGCVLLFVATLVAMVGGPPTANESLWLAIIGGGAGLVLLWTFVVPLYNRFGAH
ncbi:hypothetical protein [Natronoglomus mannanivorans]|uniref:Uncharacterized protein n=1 Tax=Natronoglomus mannanivorans TaxID=2979990 RepID=A0AAP2YXL9_9EURY|nr:hypothetical protein [Halobacteria archaeon AArc-xg1-1]